MKNKLKDSKSVIDLLKEDTFEKVKNQLIKINKKPVPYKRYKPRIFSNKPEKNNSEMMNNNMRKLKEKMFKIYKGVSENKSV